MNSQNDIDIDRMRQSVHQLMVTIQTMVAAQKYGLAVTGGPGENISIRVNGLGGEMIGVATTVVCEKVLADDGIDFEDKMRALDHLENSLKSATSLPTGMVANNEQKTITQESIRNYLSLAYDNFLSGQVSASNAIKKMMGQDGSPSKTRKP